MNMRVTTYRLIPKTRANYDRLYALSEAGRRVYNELLGRHKAAYEAWVEAGKPEDGRPPSPTFYTLGRQFTGLRREEGWEWLHEHAFVVVRHTGAKRLSLAYAKFFRDGHGFPKFKGAGWGDDGFDIPLPDCVRDGELIVPKLGRFPLRRRGGDPWAEVGECRQAVVTRDRDGKWWAHVFWRLPEGVGDPVDSGGVVGLDMNAGQIAASTGEMTFAPDVSKLECRRRRYQRRLSRQKNGSGRKARTRAKVAKTARAIARKRANWRHHVSRSVANAVGAVALEDLKTKRMTRRGGSRKRGLNRVILATGWSDLQAKLAYKVSRVVLVNPRDTSRTCHECGAVSKESRRTQSSFVCVGCGHESNADVNAALNICRRGLAELDVEGRRLKRASPMSRQEMQLGWQPAVNPAV